MSDETTSADLDIEYLYAHAERARIGVDEADEEVFLELVGKQHSDGKDEATARLLAFRNFEEMKRVMG